MAHSFNVQSPVFVPGGARNRTDTPDLVIPPVGQEGGLKMYTLEFHPSTDAMDFVPRAPQPQEGIDYETTGANAIPPMMAQDPGMFDPARGPEGITHSAGSYGRYQYISPPPEVPRHTTQSHTFLRELEPDRSAPHLPRVPTPESFYRSAPFLSTHVDPAHAALMADAADAAAAGYPTNDAPQHSYFPIASGYKVENDREVHSFFVNPNLHKMMADRFIATHTGVPTPTTPTPNPIPRQVGNYVALSPLDQGKASLFPTMTGPASAQNPHLPQMPEVPSALMYKAWSVADGSVYALRRLPSFSFGRENTITLVDRWTRIYHPTIVQIKEAFTTKAFGDDSLIFVYKYYPSAYTLYEGFLSPGALQGRTAARFFGGSSASAKTPQGNTDHTSKRKNANTNMAGSKSTSARTPKGMDEKMLWALTFQIASAMKHAETNGLRLKGSISLNHIIMTGPNRFRLSACSVADVAVSANSAAQHGPGNEEDRICLARVLIALASRSPKWVQDLPGAVAQMQKMYSNEFLSLLHYMVVTPMCPELIIKVCFEHTSDAFVVDLLGSQDALEKELMRELENSRIVRTLTKMNIITERPEFGHDPRWAETGDRYVIKLFRDYVFHQVDANGEPLTDLTHILTCLNKLDAGSKEYMALVSRDEQSCILARFDDVRRCMELAYRDLSPHPMAS